MGQTAIVIPGEFWWLMCANDGASFVKVLVVPSCIAIREVLGIQSMSLELAGCFTLWRNGSVHTLSVRWHGALHNALYQGSALPHQAKGRFQNDNKVIYCGGGGRLIKPSNSVPERLAVARDRNRKIMKSESITSKNGSKISLTPRTLI